MEFVEGVEVFVESLTGQETPSGVLYGRWSEAIGGVVFDDGGVPADADAVVLTKLLADDLELTVEIDGEEKTVKLKNKLKDGERVAAVRSPDGQRYFIIGRI